ncbi:MAG: pirin family protein [Armatimonadetes bacterium]|nr:pirin family protein [Armatimonadota bacterium]
MKQVKTIHRPQGSHWVGDGFPVRTLFSYGTHGQDVSPFLLFDHAGPKVFEPSDAPRGVEEHPHRGFETVTIVYSGGLQHRDSGGHAGKIGPGDVQWMTAASGVVHEEMHSPEFTQTGGEFHVVQLWVNLPAAEKMSVPRYQEILNADIPVANGLYGTVRVIAGTFEGTTGPAKTVTPVGLWDMRLEPGRVEFSVPEGHNALAAVLDGSITTESGQATANEVVVWSPEGGTVSFDVTQPATVLFLSGEPIDEPIAGYGPFVMNTQAEIRQAIADYQSGKMGRLQPVGSR